MQKPVIFIPLVLPTTWTLLVDLIPGWTWFMLQEGVKTENDHINLKVAGQDGSVVQFKIKRHTPLSKLMKAYCERQVSGLFFYSLSQTNRLTLRWRWLSIAFLMPNWLLYSKLFSLFQGLSIRQIRFRFDGQPINETDTPAQVGELWCWRWSLIVESPRFFIHLDCWNDK